MKFKMKYFLFVCIFTGFCFKRNICCPPTKSCSCDNLITSSSQNIFTRSSTYSWFMQTFALKTTKSPCFKLNCLNGKSSIKLN